MNRPVDLLSKNITSILIWLLITIPFKTMGQTSLTLVETVNRALEENPNLSSAEANLEASRFNVALAKSNYLPGMNILGSISQSKTATFSQTAGIIPSSSALAGASLSQMIYDENKVANIKIQKYLLASQEEMYRQTRYSIISAAGMAYIGLLFAQDLLKVQEENILITGQNLLAARDRYNVGSTNLQEVLRWETQFFADKQAIQSQKAAVIIAKGHLNQLLNKPIETAVMLEGLTLEKNGFIFSNLLVAGTADKDSNSRIIRDYLVELGLANSPVLASLEQQLLAQNRQLEANKRWAIPNFNASATADAKFDLNSDNTETSDDDKGFWKVGLTMHVPIVTGGANVNKVKQSTWQMSALEYQRDDIKSSLEQSIRASAAVVISDFINISFANEQTKAAHKNYELVYDAYKEGESSLLSLLDGQNQKILAEIAARVALYTFFNNLLTLEQVIGFFPFLEPQENVQVLIQELQTRLLDVNY